MNRGFFLLELLVVVVIIFLVSRLSYSADVTVSTALTSSDDEIIMDSNDTVTITSSGSIIVNNHDNGGLIQLPAGTSNLTITNSGTLQIGEYNGVNSQANQRNVIGAGGTATNITITNNGVIAASGRVAINLAHGEGDITINNNAGAIITCVSSSAIGCVYLNGVGGTTAGDIIITNAGTIIAQGPAHGDPADGGDPALGYNVISHHTLRLTNITGGGTITVDNSGTIEAQACCALDFNSTTDAITATNSGTIKSTTTAAVGARGTINFILNNSGTITGSGTFHKSGTDDNVRSTIDLSNQGGVTGGTGATIINSGTIEASGNDYHAISIGTGEGGDADGFDNVTITNSGTIAGDQTTGDGVAGHAIRVFGDSSGTTINVKGEPTFTGGIDLGKTTSSIVLASDITKDLTINIYNYDGDLTITDNLSGNDTYSLTSEDLDGDGAADDGILTIYGEDLDIVQNNEKNKSENVLSNLSEILNAASDGKNLQSYSSTQKRSGYKSSIFGIVGYFTRNFFIGYANQNVSYSNGEYMGGENLALGFNKTYATNQFNYSLTPVVGLADLKITDLETEGNQSIDTILMSQFMGLDAGIEKVAAISERNEVSVGLQATYGLQRFPQYTAVFTDGDLVVDDSVAQVLGTSFEIKNALGIERNIQLYVGGNWNHTYNDEIEITADGENKNVSPEMQNAFGHYAGLSLTRKVKDFNLDFNFEYGRTAGLTNQVVSLSLTKFF